MADADRSEKGGGDVRARTGCWFVGASLRYRRRQPALSVRRRSPIARPLFYVVEPSEISRRRPFATGGVGIVISSTPSRKFAFA
jgi:hypothetical protein